MKYDEVTQKTTVNPNSNESSVMMLNTYAKENKHTNSYKHQMCQHYILQGHILLQMQTQNHI